VPEVAERIIEVKAMAREAGYRTKIAVSSIDSKVDAVGACVGVRGSRIKNIVDELNGEKIDIVRWNESSQILIQNALKPAEVNEISLCFELGRATVVVRDDQLSLAIGKRGQNVRLAARLTGWDVDILTPEEFNKGLEIMSETLQQVEGIDRGEGRPPRGARHGQRVRHRGGRAEVLAELEIDEETVETDHGARGGEGEGSRRAAGKDKAEAGAARGRSTRRRSGCSRARAARWTPDTAAAAILSGSVAPVASTAAPAETDGLSRRRRPTAKRGPRRRHPREVSRRTTRRRRRTSWAAAEGRCRVRHDRT
jgi:N utilization substance protein A